MFGFEVMELEFNHFLVLIIFIIKIENQIKQFYVIPYYFLYPYLDELLS